MSDLSRSDDPDVPEGVVVLVRITVERLLYPDGRDVIGFSAVDRDGNTPPLIEMLGMLEMCKDTAMIMAAEGDEGDD